MAAKTALTVCLYCLFLFAKENRICNEIVMFASYFFPKIFFKCLNIICPKKKKKKKKTLLLSVDAQLRNRKVECSETGSGWAGQRNPLRS